MKETGKKILLVEDDRDIQKINSIHLTRHGYDVVTADTLENAYEAVVKSRPDLIVLDVNLPDGSGVSFCETLRGVTTIPIIFLTCDGQEEDKVKGLMAGADDYMTKPYGLSELTARIHALLRRTGFGGSGSLDYPPLKIDTTAHRVYLHGKDALLSHKEYQMLLILAKSAGRPISADEIYEKLWGLEPENVAKTIRVHISSIRKKLKMDGRSNARIITIRNVGYRFEYEKTD